MRTDSNDLTAVEDSLRPVRRALAVCLGAVGLLVPGLSAQEDPEARRHGIFIDSIEVSLINVEVRVTRDGEPVTDLTVEDFEILDDGEPVEISNFFRVEAGRRVAAPSREEERGPTELPRLGVLEQSSVLVLVDQPFLSLSSRKQVFAELASQLDRLMSQGARVMLVSKNRDVVIEQPLTSAPEEIAAGLDRLARVAAPDWSSEMRRVIESMEHRPQVFEGAQFGPGQSTGQASTSEIDAHSAYQQARGLSQQLHEEVRYSLALLRRFVGSLAGMAGRKALIYVADHLPLRSGELVWRVWWAKFGLEQGSKVGVSSVEAALADYDSSPDFRDLIADASSNRVAFYPIGIGSGPSLSTADSRGLSRQTVVAPRLTGSDDARRWMASGTGGEIAVGKGSFERFFKLLQQDLAHYYSLAYPSPHRGDGKNHSLEVRVRRPDIEVRYLAEYRDKSTDQQMTERTLASLFLGVGENPLGVRLEIGKVRKEDRHLFRVPVEVHIPVADLVLLPDRTSHMGKLSIQLIARDGEGRLSEPIMVRMPIEIPHRSMLQALSDSAVYPVELLMRRGHQTIAVGVHDDLGATSSTIQVSVEVGGRG